jgi:hypothetical protein
MSDKKKDVIEDAYKFVESALPSPDITVNVERRSKKRKESKELNPIIAEDLLWYTRRAKWYDNPIALYHIGSNTIVFNDLRTENFDDIIRVIDHEYLHAVLDGLGMHDETALLDIKYGRIEKIDKGGV